MDARKTFALKVNIACKCKGCVKIFHKVFEKIDGVLKYHIDVEQGKVTISGTVDPDTIIQKLKQEAGKIAELLPKERPQAVRNNQKMQIARRSKPIQGFQKQQHKDNVLTSSTSVKKNEHKHELELQNYAKRFDCNGCKEEGFGSRFRCKHCNYELHKECKSPKSTVSHDFFKGCTLKFFEKLPRKCANKYCSACGKEIFGYVYHCQEDGQKNLHPCCSTLRLKHTSEGVSFELDNKTLSNCMRCNQKAVGCNSSSSSRCVPGSWSYVFKSKGNIYKFHVYCVSEMVHEAWKKGAIGDTADSNALEKISLPLVVNSKRKGGRDDQFLKILTIVLKTIVGILLGDPTAIFASLFVQLFDN